jgi:hypothetical protein
MKKLCLVFLGLLLVALGELRVAFSTELIQEEATAPVYKNGEAWKYRAVTKYFGGSTSRDLLNGEYEITFVAGKRVIFYIEGDHKVEETDPRALVLMLPTQVVINHETRYFQFPLAVGKTWKANYFHQLYRRWISPESSVTGIESVTTPAGVFSAYRIDRPTFFSRSYTSAGETFGIYVKEIYFYCPSVRSVVNYHYQLNYQSSAGGDLVPFSVIDIELVKAPQ